MPGPMICVSLDGAEQLDVSLRANNRTTIGEIKAKVSAMTGIPVEHLHLGRILMMADADEWGDLHGDTDDSDTSDSEAPVPGAPEEEAPAQPLQHIFEGVDEVASTIGAAASAPDSWDIWMGAPAAEGAPVPGASAAAPVPGAAEAAPAASSADPGPQAAPTASSADPGPHALWLLPAPIVKYQ